ncbi:helix-turn-helix transcriptional regulator [Lysinibacillus sp. KU-BSD001]|uniref:helix-turn-helix domain-containing protein n=1 Tax=Lysinibacillus sp. KU-BSD001 TaxID=3141328 RepID=UPI0036E3AE89
MESVGERIKQARKDKGYTLAALGEKVSLTHGYLSNIENGNRQPSPEVLKSLAETLNIPYSELLYDAGYKALAKDVRLSEAVDDFSDEIDIKSYVLAAQAINHAKDLHTLLEQKEHILLVENVAPLYKGHTLSQEDRERILKMLEILFPEYQ